MHRGVMHILYLASNEETRILLAKNCGAGPALWSADESQIIFVIGKCSEDGNWDWNTTEFSLLDLRTSSEKIFPRPSQDYFLDSWENQFPLIVEDKWENGNEETAYFYLNTETGELIPVTQ